MIERYSKIFTSAKKLSEMYEEKFFPRIVVDLSQIDLCVKSPVFEYEDFIGGREVFLDILENCDRLDFFASNDGILTMTITVKE